MQKKISVELSPELHAQVKAALYGGIGAVNAYIDENGHLMYTRTTNLKDKIDFAIVNDTNLEVQIHG